MLICSDWGGCQEHEIVNLFGFGCRMILLIRSTWDTASTGSHNIVNLFVPRRRQFHKQVNLFDFLLADMILLICSSWCHQFENNVNLFGLELVH